MEHYWSGGHRIIKEYEVCGDSIIIRSDGELNREAAAFLRYVLQGYADLTVENGEVRIRSQHIDKIKEVLDKPALRYQERK